jgi:hypothetical protein
MKNKPDKKTKLSNKRIEKLVDKSVNIETLNVFERNALGYYSSAFISTTLPHKNPGDTTTTFTRKSNNQYFTIQAGYDAPKEKYRGLPHGPYPRLLLIFVMTEATKTQNPVITLGNSLSEFMNKIGIVPYGGRHGSITRLKNQMNRLFHSRISIQKITKENDMQGEQSTEFLLSDKKDLWWSVKSPNQSIMWDSTITLSDKFFNEIISSPVPIDLDIIKGIKNSPLAIDLYLFLTHRVFKLKKPAKIPWLHLHNQMGAKYTDTRNFTYKCKKQLEIICELYKGLHLGYDKGNLILYPSSRTSVPSSIPR